jgi:hypothetical protein
MNGAADWRDAKYDEILDQETRGLERRRASDPACSVEDLEAILLNLYHQDGSDWVGRGNLQDTVMAATIAAYEAFIHAWKTERQAI